jgi:hypothetical protein
MSPVQSLTYVPGLYTLLTQNKPSSRRCMPSSRGSKASSRGSKAFVRPDYDPPAGAGYCRSMKHSPCELRCPCVDCV